MTRLRITITTALLAAVALIAPAASHASEPDDAGHAVVVTAGDATAGAATAGDDLVAGEGGEQLIPLLGWNWGG